VRLRWNRRFLSPEGARGERETERFANGETGLVSWSHDLCINVSTPGILPSFLHDLWEGDSMLKWTCIAPQDRVYQLSS
jgi:hypothetical protein